MDKRGADIAQVLMTWEPDDVDGAVARITRSIESFASACKRGKLNGAVLLADGAFDAAWCGGRLTSTSHPDVLSEAELAAGYSGLMFHRTRGVGGWPCESFKLTAALRAAARVAPVIIRLDSDEVIDLESDLGDAVSTVRRGRYHGAMVIWDTVGNDVLGSQGVGSKKHLRIFSSNPTLTAGPSYHGSYKAFTGGKWLSLRKRGDENGGLESARIANCCSLVRLINHPSERSKAMHEAKARLLSHRHEGARSDR